MTINYCGPAFLKPLIELTGWSVYDRVVRIDLYGPEIDDSVASVVGKFTNLHEIEFRNTSVTDQCLDKLCNTRPKCKITSNSLLMADNAE